MNRRAKGARAELKAQRELEAGGYLVARAPPGSMFNHHDFFELFDLIAINKKEIRMIQVTCGAGASTKRNLIDTREKMLPFIEGVTYEVWRLIPRRGWRVWLRGGGPCRWVEVGESAV